MKSARIFLILIVASGCSAASSLEDEREGEQKASPSVQTTAGVLATPELIASQVPAFVWKLDGADFFFTGGGDASPTDIVGRMPVGGGTYTALASGQPVGWGIATDSEKIFWGGLGYVRTMPKAGGIPTTLWAEDNQYGTWLATDGTTVFFTTRENSGGNRLRRVPIAGGTSQVLYETTSTTDLTELGLDTNNVYTAYRRDFLRIPKGGGTPTVVASFNEEPCRIHYDGAVAFLNLGNTIARLPLAGGTPLTVFDGTVDGKTVYGCLSLAADANNLYFSAYTEPFTVEGIFKVAKTGGAAVQIAAGQKTIYNMGVDAKYVYWSTGSAEVFRIPK
ncbi:hypothetical protein LZC95_48650 [Pendulispora brunnea]|uniref:Uncharacterized protein n=1 Tax=Pendulispora brunnea TaxID=2905690 RepID=A0ABZ2K6K3_9BACT